MTPSQIFLENGQSFTGYSPYWQKDKHFNGEVIFNTGMTGYVESLTDPSYAGQILTFTYPLIGNYGIPLSEHWESKKIHPKGVIVCQTCEKWSHHSSHSSLEEWLYDQQIPMITGVDTRALTKILRDFGTMRGIISCDPNFHPVFPSPEENLVAQVTVSQPSFHFSGKKLILAIDCGMKENILRSFSTFPVKIKRVPYNYDYLQEDFDGLFISNGPGDPKSCEATIEKLRCAMVKEKPIFGICLGAQLLALAAGANTYKLPFGHRGHNHPCLELETKRCYITSQNHGYAILENSLPKDWKVTFKNLNDGSIEGISHISKPFFAVQFHPEASPGPTDTSWLFKQFYRSL